MGRLSQVSGVETLSKRCDECRPRWGCFVCGNTGHTQKGCPVRPAFGGGLARGLEFKSGIPRAKLIDERHDPAMKKEKASGVRMVREIQVAMGFPDPANVAVVERGQSSVGRRGYTSLRGRRGDSTPRARKRDRSESGDALPLASKRGAPDRHGERVSPPPRQSGEFRAQLSDAMDDMEARLTSLLSKELHELKENLGAKLETFETRIRDLENHV